MNWDTINFDWNHIKAFLVTSEEGSFSAAARILKTTQPTINRQISGLETSLGVTLFERGKRGLKLTAGGRELVNHVQAMGASASRISMVATSQSENIEGEVSITAADLMCLHFILPIMPKLTTQYPGLKIHMLASNDIQDLSRREADIAIRHVRPEQPDLTAKLVATYTARFYASPSFIKQNGYARSPEDLRNYPIIGVNDPERFIQIVKDLGVELDPEQFTHATNSAVLSIEMVRAGLGVALLPDQVSQHDPGLEPITRAIPPLEFPVWLVTHRELHTSRKIRVVFNALDQVLKRNDE